MVLQGKEHPEELRSGEIESADDHEIQDIVDSVQLIRHEKAHETAPHHRMKAEEDAVQGEPETGSFGQTGADGDEIDQHQREEAEQDSVQRIIPNRLQRKGPIGENPDGKGHPGRGLNPEENRGRLIGTDGEGKQEMPVRHQVRRCGNAVSRTLLLKDAVAVFRIEGDRIRNRIFEGEVKFPGGLRPVGE